MKKLLARLFGFEPMAVITVSRRTAEEETAQITVNAYKLNRADIYNALAEAGEALRLRLIENNNYMANLVKDPIPAMGSKKLTSVKGGNA